MNRMARVALLAGALAWGLVALPGWSPPWAGAGSGIAHASDSVDEAKAKSLEALEAIARALQDLAKKAEAQAKEAAESAREEIRTSLEKACDAALRTCQEVCGSEATCLRACKEGRRQCKA